MNFYETLYIVHPALEAGRLKDIIVSIEDNLKKMGGEPLAVELWGKRKLSHYIDKQKYGTYVLLQYNGKGKCTGDFAVELEHNPNILAYLTTHIDQNEVLKQEEDLDTQIAGKTRESERIESKSTKHKEETSSSEAERGDNTAEPTDSEEHKQENTQELETNDEKEGPEEEQIDLSSKESGDDQKTKGKDSKTENGGTTGDEKEEESNQKDADETTAISKEE